MSYFKTYLFRVILSSLHQWVYVRSWSCANNLYSLRIVDKSMCIILPFHQVTEYNVLYIVQWYMHGLLHLKYIHPLWKITASREGGGAGGERSKWIDLLSSSIWNPPPPPPPPPRNRNV